MYNTRYTTLNLHEPAKRLFVRFSHRTSIILSIILIITNHARAAISIPLRGILSATTFVAKEALRGGLAYYACKETLKFALNHFYNPQNFKLLQLKAQVYQASPRLPKPVKKTLLNTINDLHPASSEQSIAALIQFISIALRFPWNIKLQPQTNLRKIENALNSSIFGMQEAKNAVLDIVFAYNSGMTNKIPPICLVGPPGVGKTAFALTIAEALNLPSLIISAAGLSDPDIFFRGCSKAYQGALPGFFVTGLTSCACSNPVIVIDEIDKAAIGNIKGTVQNILLQVFDPLQNQNFRDHFLDMSLNISNPIYITTANTRQAIIEPLQDRMIIIEIPDYSENERNLMANTILWNSIPKSNKIPLAWRKTLIEAALAKTAASKSIRDLKNHLTQSVVRWLRTH